MGQKGSILIVAAAVASCHGFARVPPPRLVSLKHYATSIELEASTPLVHQGDVEVEANSNNSAATTPTQRTALSMTLEELSETLKGLGRSQITWDCLKLGVDPYYLFTPDDVDPSSLSKQQQQHVQYWNEYADKEALKKQVIPTPRQSQPLGSSTLNIFDEDSTKEAVN